MHSCIPPTTMSNLLSLDLQLLLTPTPLSSNALASTLYKERRATHHTKLTPSAISPFLQLYLSAFRVIPASVLIPTSLAWTPPEPFFLIYSLLQLYRSLWGSHPSAQWIFSLPLQLKPYFLLPSVNSCRSFFLSNSSPPTYIDPNKDNSHVIRANEVCSFLSLLTSAAFSIVDHFLHEILSHLISRTSHSQFSSPSCYTLTSLYLSPLQAHLQGLILDPLLFLPYSFSSEILSSSRASVNHLGFSPTSSQNVILSPPCNKLFNGTLG